MTLEKLLKKHGLKIIKVNKKTTHSITYPSILEIYDLIIHDAAQFFAGKKKTQYADICRLLHARGCTNNEFDELCASLDKYKKTDDFSRKTGIALSTILAVLPAKMTIDTSTMPVPPDYLCMRLANKEYTLLSDVGKCFGYEAEDCTFMIENSYGDHLGKGAKGCTFYIRNPCSPFNIPYSNTLYHLQNGKWRRWRGK